MILEPFSAPGFALVTRTAGAGVASTVTKFRVTNPSPGRAWVRAGVIWTPAGDFVTPTDVPTISIYREDRVQIAGGPGNPMIVGGALVEALPLVVTDPYRGFVQNFAGEIAPSFFFKFATTLGTNEGAWVAVGSICAGLGVCPDEWKDITDNFRMTPIDGPYNVGTD